MSACVLLLIHKCILAVHVSWPHAQAETGTHAQRREVFAFSLTYTFVEENVGKLAGLQLCRGLQPILAGMSVGLAHHSFDCNI